MNSDEGLRRHLESLPQPAMSDRLEARVRAAHRTRGRRLRGGLAGIALALIGSAAILLAWPDGSVQPQAESTTAITDTAAPGDAAQGQVQAIDRALQAAYDHDASEDEIDSLWQARRQLLAAATPPERT